MCSTLKDARLVQLQQEGGASLAWLRRDEVIGATEERRVAVEAATSLYDRVDELLHRLVTLSNTRTQELSFIAEFRGLERGFSQVRLSTLSEGVMAAEEQLQLHCSSRYAAVVSMLLNALRQNSLLHD